MALVAERDGDVVGHVMVSDCALHDDERGVVHTIAMLSPLAVAPDVQRDGIGSALVRSVCGIADDAGDQVVILEGSPRYYPRFGFVDARTLGITIHLPDWAPPEAGQALPLRAWDGSLAGNVVYPPPFDGLD
jgi:putative acetyltransferase